jgi:hypothetical protein
LMTHCGHCYQEVSGVGPISIRKVSRYSPTVLKASVFPVIERP